MEKTELKKMIESATEERLREIVNDWIDNNDEFRKFVEHELNPPLDEIDFDTELVRAMMVRTFRNYAEDRFGYKKKVKSGTYSYCCQDLHKLADIGMTEELCELVTYFKEEYKTRPSLMAELRKIKLK